MRGAVSDINKNDVGKFAAPASHIYRYRMSAVACTLVEWKQTEGESRLATYLAKNAQPDSIGYHCRSWSAPIL